MARQVLPWVGAAVGAYFGNPQLGFMIGSMVGNAVDPQVIKGPRLGEGQDNRASEGGYRPIVIGKGAVGSCLIHQGPLKKRTIRTRQSKGGGPVTEEERAYRTFAFALGESAYPDTGVTLLRIWIDNKLRYDATPESEIGAESAEFANQFTFYPGNETQQPDPDIEAFMGAGNVPSYRGGCPYIVLPEWDVTDSRGTMPMLRVELATTSRPPAFMMLIRNLTFNPGTGTGYLLLDQGFNGSWVDDASLGFNARHAVSTQGRVVVWSASSSHPVYTTNRGHDWQESTGAATGNASVGWAVGNEIMIAAGASFPIRYSADAGESFIEVGGAIRSELITAINMGGNTRWLSWYNNASPVGMRYSDNSGGTWSGAVDIGLDNASGGSAGSDGETAMFGGHAAFASTPMLVSTDSGIGFNVEEIPAFADATTVTAVCGHAGAWVCGTDSGEVAWRDGDGAWHLSEDAMPEGARVGSITHNGLEFVLVSAPSLTGRVYILSTPDGSELTVQRDEFIGQNNVISNIVTVFPEAIAEKVPLSEIVGWLHSRLETPPTSFNATELTDLVEGVVFADAYTGASALKALMALYFFGGGEYDAGNGYRINYVKLGKPAALTLTDQDVVEAPEEWEREDSYERPKVLHVAYQNPVADYGAPNIVIKRTSPDVLVVGERSVSVPVVFSDANEITRRADIMMTIIYTEIAGTYKIVLPWSLLALAPTDCIGFSIRGRTRRLRLDQWRFSPDGTIACEFMADRQSATTSNVTGLPAVRPTPPPPSIVGPTTSAVLDIPALTDDLDSLHLIVAATGVSPGWYGADHQRRLAGDSDYVSGARFSGVTTIMGALDADVTDAAAYFTDTTNTVRVTLYRNDELETFTQAQFLSENGAFALSWLDDGVRRWEVMQYRDAVKVGELTWELTTLARGRLNTLTAPHPVGSVFVLLDAGIRAMPMPIAAIGQDVLHRSVSFGQTPDQAVPYSEPFTGQSQVEWPVAELMLEIAGDDLVAKAVPRHRFGTSLHPVRSANWQGYRWTASDGVNSATAEGQSDTHTFDVSGWATPITVSVAQINRLTGPGPAVSEDIA